MTETPPEPPDVGPEGPVKANDPATEVDGGASDGPSRRDEVEADLDDPIEPRMKPAEDPDVEGDGDGDETLVSEGDPPSTANG
jgi:hypothetical protein